MNTSQPPYNERWAGSWIAQPNADVFPAANATLPEPILVAVRHGSLRDLVSVYAFINGKVYRSKEWGDFGPGNTFNGVIVGNNSTNGYTIKGFPFSDTRNHDVGAIGNPTSASSFGTITFNFDTLTWSYTSGNGAGFSSDPNRQERILVVEPS